MLVLIPCCVHHGRAVLLEWFTSPSLSTGSSDAYQYIAMVLMNLTRLKPARQLLLEPGRRFLAALATQLESKDVIRRRGCAGSIRNCCFSPEVHSSLLLHDSLEILVQQCGIQIRAEASPSVLTLAWTLHAFSLQAASVRVTGPAAVFLTARERTCRKMACCSPCWRRTSGCGMSS